MFHDRATLALPEGKDPLPFPTTTQRFRPSAKTDLLLRAALLNPGKEQERLALEAGFASAKHYEISFGLMGALVARKGRKH